MSEFCHRCDRWFRNIDQHMRMSSRHHICYECDIDFTSWVGLKEHWVQSLNHAYCQYCDQHFDDREELKDHYETRHYYCRQCNKLYMNEYGLSEHYRQSARHAYRCKECKRDFQSASNLNSHMNSSVHRGRTVGCPFAGCGRFFVSTSALILHLEGGRCASGVDRNQVNRYVRQIDKKNIITNPSRLLTGGSEHVERKWIATEASWNGRFYECYLCHCGFNTLAALNTHLASPRHQEKIYVCPAPECRIKFSVLSALCQHIESEKCGVSKFKQVKDTMDMISNFGRLTF